MNWVGSNGLGLELQTGVLPVTGPNSCGWGVEGYDGMFQNHLQRIHDLGGTLSVLNLDEPLFFWLPMDRAECVSQPNFNSGKGNRLSDKHR